ncbi:hypothetical protein [Sediminibacillus albus]|uniref:DUF4362 domain-containing protein n=1 Tax=Sediminibacillus albus TaxID=407036 RepID=A0A1G9BAR7_9BACI|nr:hypothetical protein [Sediminibacillus albus]SDK35965.1 hypothetical protein SAMN05216243_2882 [Sediminibacillus albus]
MRKTLLCLILTVTALTACSDADSKENYSIDDAKAAGDVIAQHQVTTFDEIVQGAVEVDNLENLIQLIDNVEQNNQDKVDISIFDLDGSHSKNIISYDGKMITFENNYGQYEQSPAGTFTCSYISQRGPIVYLSSCQAEDGTEHSTMIGFIGTEDAFREARNATDD